MQVLELVNLRKVAITTGFALIVMAICAAFSVGFVNSKLIVEGNDSETLMNIQTSLSLFQVGIVNCNFFPIVVNCKLSNTSL
ncbi:uncharacterized protein DUF4386 [Ureibacillus xyleni]|uniref:Uncharacterized protein DUF4386 n=1 Tax=Ureibacillus xyleni TaxID=614648 RepID=A0A285SST3_9BACL|nr:DUF4386 family protein [Ureibacillus xyleni]SOC11550.1 uncharacterized protein DUF4386 [Ureibacillus xyleni]